jgi:hypothetical protein
MTADSPSVAEARARLTAARARFTSTVDEIIERGEDLLESLTPHNLARDAWEAAKSKGADIAEDAVDAVSKRPVAATGIVAAVALFLAREPLMDLADRLMHGKDKSKAHKGQKEKMETT